MKENKQNYVEPLVQIITIEVEKGYTASEKVGNINPWEVESW